MNQRERLVVAGVLAVIAIFVMSDTVTDSAGGLVRWYILIERIIGVAALAIDQRRSTRRLEFQDELNSPPFFWKITSPVKDQEIQRSE